MPETSIKPIKVLFVTTYTKWDAPPMAAAYLYGYLKKNEAFELTFTGGYESDTELENIIKKDSYEIIACGGMFIYMDYFKKVFEMAEKFCPEAKRISGGAAIEGLGAEYVFSNLNIHAAVIGEGEKTLEDLILAFRDQRDLSSVKGIVYRDSGNNLISTAPRELIDLKTEDLQADYSFFDMELYFKMSGRRGFAILGSRGCPNRCNFCHSTFPGYRLRNTDEIVTEIKKFYDLYKLSYFSFGDETFASNIDKLKELCSKLKAAVPNARWGCGLRANIVNEEKLKIMKEGGCNFIQLGVESGSDRILKLMNKNTTAEQNLKAIQMIKSSGIQLGISIMYGYKDETEDDIRKTTDLLIQTNEIPEFHSHVTPVPGTVLFKQAEGEGRIPDLTEYIKIMNRGIYIYNGLPALNLTRIPDSAYYSFLISEQRRLWTEHFRKNRAFVISYTEERTEHFSVKNKCPHCGSESDSKVLKSSWWTFCHCVKCSGKYWISSEFLDTYKAQSCEINRMIEKQKTSNCKAYFYNQNNPDTYHLFKIDIWKDFWQSVSGIINNTDSFYDVPVVKRNDTAKIAKDSIIYVADNDPVGIHKSWLMEKGFSPENIVYLFPQNSNGMLSPKDSFFPHIRKSFFITMLDILSLTGYKYALYGAGRHTQWLMEHIESENRTKPDFLLDDRDNLADIGGLPVQKPEQLKNMDIGKLVIIISTDLAENALKMEDNLRSLLPEAKLFNPYKEFPSGPYT